MLSINGEIRKAINKTGGAFVTVSIYLISKKEKISKKQILETFKESGVLEAFEKLNEVAKNEIVESIIYQKKEENQIKTIIEHIEGLTV